MATENKVETLATRMKTIEDLVNNTPTTGPQLELAMALAKLGGVQKSLRKLQKDWTDSLVNNARQGAL